MRAWDSVTRGGSLRPGLVALIVLLTGLLLSLTPVSLGLDGAYYDLLQRLQAGPASDGVILVDTRKLAPASGTVWNAARLPDLLAALGETQAVVLVEPPPATNSLPDPAQLATLAEIERLSRADGESPAVAFSLQLAEIRRRSELQARTASAAQRLPHLIVAVPTFDGTRAAEIAAGDCRKHVLPVAAGADSGTLDTARRVRAVVPTPGYLCDAAESAAHVEFWPDDDGVVRRTELLVNASGMLVPSAALSAALATAGESRPGLAGSGALSWNDHEIRSTGAGPTTLLRFHGQAAPFETLDAKMLLADLGVRKRVAGRIAIVGPVSPDTGVAYLAANGERLTATVLVATALSNLLENAYLVRPAWAPVAESALMLLLGGLIVLRGARLPPALGAMVGVLAGAMLLAIEALAVSHSGVWLQLATPAAFVLLGMASIPLLQSRDERPGETLVPSLASAVPAGAAVPLAASSAGDELDLAFSMLRHQPPSDHVKQRLYDVALEHARRKDLAKAERVLRHLASVDPQFRGAGEKLKKLAGLRSGLPAAAPARAPASPSHPRDGAALTGRTIGRYQLEQAIGKGAMATVYLGRDPKINRRVAIKTIALAEEFSDSDLVNARTQFLREAESAGRLNHPNIISIYDAGEDDEVAYLAMEYFPGKPLSAYAQQAHLLPPQRVFELMARAAEALHYAHAQHVVHRDVKPANLLYDSDSDTLKITDFGIARLTDTSRTKTGIILGTPSYMSPEQLAGTNVTGQSDLFSLGVTLYQLLTGMPPFRADSIPRLMQKIAHERHEAVRLIRNDLPTCADDILDRALAKDPSDRFPNGRAMALAMRDCCSSFDSRSTGQP